MRIGFIAGMFLWLFVLPVCSQEKDTVSTIRLDSVVIVKSAAQAVRVTSALSVEAIDERFLREHFTGNLVKTLEHTPGIHSMDIGSGFSKPMIRGMGFNRISVVENGIKQEGQQWGDDHGLELDVFNAERVIVRKGPASLLYGSDAMGGSIELTPFLPPVENQIMGEAVFSGKSINENTGASLMIAGKKDQWFTKFRYSEQHFGDYHVPADTIVYLTRMIPLYGRKMKNTAGWERNVSFYAAYRNHRYYSDYSAGNVYQKVGFFPGAHGIPNLLSVEDDGNSRNIGLPFSNVNHLKISTHQQYAWDKMIAYWDAGFQDNRRQEWSRFHTHYGSAQPLPDKEPDKELEFSLQTFSSTLKMKFPVSDAWEHTAGWDMQYQQNAIGGYSFLLPEYRRFTSGMFALTTYRPNKKWLISGGLRYDYGRINVISYSDPYLAMYLQGKGVAQDEIERYKWRSYGTNFYSGDFSASVGIVWTPDNIQLIKANIGKSFRLPGANELAANGVHHGTFRYEQGDASLSSEKAWQLDASYRLENKRIRFDMMPFFCWFGNYIYLKPTGEWSILDDAGQIYRFTETEALFAGIEISLEINLFDRFDYHLNGEYVHTYNRRERTPLSFSPPASFRNTLEYRHEKFQTYLEIHSIAAQNRNAANEDPTPGANLIHWGASTNLSAGGTKIELTFSVQNLLNTKYYNHLSFYRKVEIPEPGRNFQILIKIPFKKLFK
ncbi:MAG: TonB-dependent receptor [Dysgonamonadaceae bacterium]|jgi:iron complex outermembrane receptor protein|nr:TonB-dependent receptor [Dysgonamonadaceae bacterium]